MALSLTYNFVRYSYDLFREFWEAKSYFAPAGVFDLKMEITDVAAPWQWMKTGDASASRTSRMGNSTLDDVISWGNWVGDIV